MELPGLSVLKSSNNLQIEKFSGLLAPAAALAASFLIILLVVWPKFSQTLRLKTANQELAVRAQSLEEKVQKLRGLEPTALEEQLAAAEQLLPSDKSVFLLVTAIEKAAAASGVILSRLEVSPGAISEGLAEKSPAKAASTPGDASDANKILLKISLASDYKSSLQFLINVLSVSRVVAARDLTVSASSSQSSQVRVTLQLEAYWKSLPQKLASIETSLADLTDTELERLSQIIETGLSASGPVPQVPLGRGDLFAPF